jgi:hypothetical protein
VNPGTAVTVGAILLGKALERFTRRLSSPCEVV